MSNNDINYVRPLFRLAKLSYNQEVIFNSIPLLFSDFTLETVSTRCQFHQHFMRKFFVQMSFQQLFSSYMYVKEQRSYKKCVRKMLMKLTANKKIVFIYKPNWLN